MCNGKITFHRTISKKKRRIIRFCFEVKLSWTFCFRDQWRILLINIPQNLFFFGMNISFLQYGKKHEMVRYRNLVNSFVSFHFFKDDGLIHEKKVWKFDGWFFLFYTITKLHLLFKAKFKLHCHNIEKRNLLSFDPRHIIIIFFADKWSNEYATL